MASRALRVLALVGAPDGPALWRVYLPFASLKRAGYPSVWAPKSASGVGDVAPLFDGYVLPRMAWPIAHRADAERWFQMVHDAGRFVVYDADDDIFSRHLTARFVELGMTNGATETTLASDRIERIWCLKQCDGVTVSTQRLATIVRTYTDAPVVVVPNAIDVPWFRTALKRSRASYTGVAIGWVGGRRPSRDVEAMARAWSRLAERYGDGVTFVAAGDVPAAIVESVPSERLALVPWLPLDRYPEAYGGLDVACCSVADEPFNYAKSQIKAYESAIAGAAVVATPTLYGSLIEHGVTGYVAETADAWYDALVDLVERPAVRAMMARRLLRRVERSHALADNLWRWPAAWQTIAEHAHARRRKIVVAR